MTDTIIVTGANGMLGSQVVLAARRQRIQVVPLTREACDITNVSQVRDAFRPFPGATVINCAGVVPHMTVSTPRMANVNGRGPHVLARVAERVVQVSTDCVFAGKPPRGVEGYTESSRIDPADHYGRSKLSGELTGGSHLTVRGSFVGFGKWGLLAWLLGQPKNGTVKGYINWWWNGVYVRDYAEHLIRLAHHDITGIVHLIGPTVMTKHRLLAVVAKRLRPDLTVVEANAPTRRKMILASARIPPIPASWTQMLQHLEEDYHRERGSG